MTHTTFDDGLVRGVDSSVKVSHKFGFFVIDKADEGAQDTNELHDCGIVYHVQHPYIMCVMTKGMNQDGLISFIGQASQIAFDYVSNNYAK